MKNVPSKREDCKIGDSEKVPKGKCLVWSQGAVLEYFRTSTAPSDAKKAEIQKNLPSLYKGKDDRVVESRFEVTDGNSSGFSADLKCLVLVERSLGF